jgi:hypothetical protein
VRSRLRCADTELCIDAASNLFVLSGWRLSPAAMAVKTRQLAFLVERSSQE